MKFAIKLLSMAMAVIMLFSFAACGDSKKGDDKTTSTTAISEDVDADVDADVDDEYVEEDTEEAEDDEEIEDEDEAEEEAEDSENDAEDSENDADDTTKKKSAKKNSASKKSSTKKSSTEKSNTKKSFDEKAIKKKSDKKTTKKKSDSKSTTKKKNKKSNYSIGESKEAIVKAYNKAANAAKAKNNINVDKTSYVEIAIESVAGSKAIGKLANSVAKKFMGQNDGKPQNEVFKNGKPTKTLVNEATGEKITKNWYFPLENQEVMSRLTPDCVKSATRTKKSDGSYVIKIVIKDDKSLVTGKPKYVSAGMNYFDPVELVGQLDGFEFTDGYAVYKDCIIDAKIDKNGTLTYVKHTMPVASENLKVKYGVKLSAVMHGRYETSFTFHW